MVHKFDGGQMRVSGYHEHDKLSKKQKSAKTVTSLLMLPSVLGVRSVKLVINDKLS